MKQFITFLVMLASACTHHGNPANTNPDQLDDGIQTATLTDVGIDDGLIKAMHDSITAGVYSNIRILFSETIEEKLDD